MDKSEILRALRAKGFTTITTRRGYGTGTFAYRVNGCTRDVVGFGTRTISYYQEVARHLYLGPSGASYRIPETETKRRRIPVRAGYFTMNDFLASL